MALEQRRRVRDLFRKAKLTEPQRQAVQVVVNDISLTRLARHRNVSRQAVNFAYQDAIDILQRDMFKDALKSAELTKLQRNVFLGRLRSHSFAALAERYGVTKEQAKEAYEEAKQILRQETILTGSYTIHD